MPYINTLHMTPSPSPLTGLWAEKGRREGANNQPCRKPLLGASLPDQGGGGPPGRVYTVPALSPKNPPRGEEKGSSREKEKLPSSLPLLPWGVCGGGGGWNKRSEKKKKKKGQMQTRSFSFKQITQTIEQQSA